jgi:N-acetylglucosamine-6-phosphate deacetylase
MHRRNERAAMISTITGRRLISAGRTVDHPLITIDEGRISNIEALDAADQRCLSAIHRFPDATLVPSYIDIHIHGCAGHDITEATPEAFATIGAYLATRGVGAYFPTTVTSPLDQTLRSLANLAAQIERSQHTTPIGATPLGIHLEGPFLSHRKRGVHNESLLEAPSIALFERLWQASEGHIQLLTIAPELPGALELIAHAAKLGVRCSMGHSDATVREAGAGFTSGACSATHTFNAMRALDHRDPGLAAYVLDQDGLFAELICDGIHVDPMMVRLFYKAKDADRIILITDGISATGMPDGIYMLGNMQVELHDGRCTSNGTLAGSVLTLDRAVKNFVDFTGASLNTAVAAASSNPSRLMGIDDRWGSIEVGRVANITVLSPASSIMQTFLAGHPSIA